MSKNILLILLLIFSCNSEILQKKVVSIVEENNEIIIEGTVVSDERHFYDGNIYTSCLVEINTIFKGEISDKIVEVFVRGGDLGLYSGSVSHGQIFLPKKKYNSNF